MKLLNLSYSTKAQYSMIVVLLILLSSCSSDSIESKKIYKSEPSDFNIEVVITGGKSGWHYQYISENGIKKAVRENQISLPALKTIKFSGTSKDVIRTCLIRETDQRLDKIPKNVKIESNLKLDLVPGFNNEEVIIFSEPKIYTMSCFVDGSIKQLDIIKLIVS